MKKYLHYDLIRILKENTDRDHPMLQKDLLTELQKKDEKINRTTVWNALNDLLANSPETRVHHLGEEAEALSDGDKRPYFTDLYYDQEFTDAELRWLIDGILYSRNVPHAGRDELIRKLCELGNRHFRKNMNMKKIRRLAEEEPMNEELFHSIEQTGRALEEGRKITCVYNYLGPDFRLHPVYGDPDYRQLLNPYAMVVRNGFYYLICNKDNYSDMTHYRMDRMTGVAVTDLPVKSPRELDGFEAGLNLQEYMERNINMAFGKPEQITFIVGGHDVPDVIDAFVKGGWVIPLENGRYECTVRVPEYDMYRWALANCDRVTVTGPESLVAEIQDSLEQARGRYDGSHSG